MRGGVLEKAKAVAWSLAGQTAPGAKTPIPDIPPPLQVLPNTDPPFCLLLPSKQGQDPGALAKARYQGTAC